MKKILLLDGSPGQDLSDSHREVVEDLCKKLTQAGNFEYELAAIQHLLFHIQNGEVRLLVGGTEDIENYQFVVFRNQNVNRDIAAAATLYLKHAGIGYANGVEGSGSWVGKLAQMVLYAINGLPVPDTIFVKNYKDLQTLSSKTLPPPYILKDNLGVAGRRNYLINSDGEIAKQLHGRTENYMVQKYIPNDGDYRVLFIGQTQEPLIIRRKSASGSHLNNTSQGAQADLIPVSDFPPAALAAAKKAADLFGRSIAGVDILFGDAGKYYVLETNETPALASGFSPAEKLAKLDRYIKDTIG